MSKLVSYMPLPEGGASVPDWVHLLPTGSFPAVGGTQHFHADNLPAIIEASLKRGKLVLDENHSTDLAATRGGASPAMGWIVAMEPRGDGIWGRVEWTRRGRTAMEDHAYRGISPVLGTEKSSGRVLRIYRAALTNAPDITSLRSLHHNIQTEGGSEMSYPLSKLRQHLGLKADADEAAIEQALNGVSQAVSLHSRAAALAGLGNDASCEAIIATLRAGQEQVTLHSAAQKKFQEQIDELKADKAKLASERFVETAGRKKIISDKLAGELVTLHASNPDFAERLVASLPDAPSQQVTMHGAPAPGTPPSHDDKGRRALREQLGLTPDKLQKMGAV